MTIFFYKGLTRNPEIGNTPVWLLPNIWRLGRVMDTKFGMNVSNRMLLNAAKFRGYSFYHFWVIKGNPTGRGCGWGRITPTHPPRLGLIRTCFSHVDSWSSREIATIDSEYTCKLLSLLFKFENLIFQE